MERTRDEGKAGIDCKVDMPAALAYTGSGYSTSTGGEVAWFDDIGEHSFGPDMQDIGGCMG